MAKIPDKAEHRRQFAALPLPERRAVVRAVNRGVAVDKRKQAPLAVVIARRQMRLWQRAWLLGPVVGIAQISAGWQLALLNAFIGTTMLGVVARFWYLRARRAEAANLAFADGKGRGTPKDAAKGKASGRAADKAAGKTSGKAARGARSADTNAPPAKAGGASKTDEVSEGRRGRPRRRARG